MTPPPHGRVGLEVVEEKKVFAAAGVQKNFLSKNYLGRHGTGAQWHHASHHDTRGVEGAQRPNLKSKDSGFRHRFSEVEVSLWMCENGTGHEESRGPTRR